MAERFPPRGAGPNGGDTAPAASWLDPNDLGPEWTWKPGAMFLGYWKKRRLGIRDDRHAVMVAGSRAGKTRSVLIPNLRTYPGPVLVIDPKGELARETATARRALGSQVHVLDPFGVSGLPSSHFNPLDELRRSRQHIPADAAQMAEALIVSDQKDRHWTDSAKNLIKGLMLYLLTRPQEEATLQGLRRLLNETSPALAQVFAEMADSDAHDGIMSNLGTSFFSYMAMEDGRPVAFSKEMQAILSTTRQQTAPLDDIAHTAAKSSFSLADMGRQNLSIYLVLPGMRFGSHFRWLRLIIMQALAAMENNPIAHDELPAWFVLEEFAALQHMPSIETAAGYMAGFGVKLWAVLQDLTQLQAHYPQSWETFLGNAGIIQAFGNVDLTTTGHLSQRLGQTLYSEKKTNYTTAAQRGLGDLGQRSDMRSAPLLTPDEIAYHFARSTNRQLVLVPGKRPLYLARTDDD